MEQNVKHEQRAEVELAEGTMMMEIRKGEKGFIPQFFCTPALGVEDLEM